jgi:hypothetical protein
VLALPRAMSEGDEQTGQPAEEQVRGDSEELRAFAGLADLDEDLSTMHQSNAEVERWRRLSTRGLTPAAGSPGEGLDAPIVDLDATTTEMDAHAATTAPGTIAAPLPRAPIEPGSADATRKLPSVHPPAAREDETPPGGSADATRKLPSVRPELLAHETARHSFAPPRDGDSAPPGSRVVLPRSSAPPGRISSRPVKVPRPSAPPPDPSEVRGWRPSDPGETDEAIDPVVIPKPAPLPGAHRASQARSEPPVAPPATSSRPAPAPLATPPVVSSGERATLESAVEVSGALLAAILVVGVLVFFGLVFLLFL